MIKGGIYWHFNVNGANREHYWQLAGLPLSVNVKSVKKSSDLIIDSKPAHLTFIINSLQIIQCYCIMLFWWCAQNSIPHFVTDRNNPNVRRISTMIADDSWQFALELLIPWRNMAIYSQNSWHMVAMPKMFWSAKTSEILKSLMGSQHKLLRD